MENILEIALNTILVIMCVLNCILIFTFIIKLITEYKEDKKYNKLRIQHFLEIENFFKERASNVENKYIEKIEQKNKEE